MSNTVRDYSKEKLELKRLLKVHGQAKLAKDLSITPKNLNMIISGKKKFISKKTADRINNYGIKKFELDKEAIEEGMVYNFKDFTPKKDTSNVKFINTRSSDTREHIDKIRKDSINRLLRQKDELWTTIFLLCMFLIICAGVIFRLAYLVRTY
jgi:hypothetical protein